MKQIYLLTYPTGKIYIGKDAIGSCRYFGRPDMDVVNADFSTLPDEVKKTSQFESRFSDRRPSRREAATSHLNVTDSEKAQSEDRSARNSAAPGRHPAAALQQANQDEVP